MVLFSILMPIIAGLPQAAAHGADDFENFGVGWPASKYFQPVMLTLFRAPFGYAILMPASFATPLLPLFIYGKHYGVRLYRHFATLAIWPRLPVLFMKFHTCYAFDRLSEYLSSYYLMAYNARQLPYCPFERYFAGREAPLFFLRAEIERLLIDFDI
jgi:hypothetical protein